MSNASKVALPANGVVNAATGAAYTGQVSVYATYIDPTAADINQIVPGSFMADDKDGKRVYYASEPLFSMIIQNLETLNLRMKINQKNFDEGLV